MDPARRPTSQRLNIPDWTEIRANLEFDYFCELFRRVLDAPSIKIGRLLIKTRKNAREKSSIARVAVRGRRGQDPLFGAGRCRRRWSVIERAQIRNIGVLPRCRIFLSDSAAAFGEACIADFSVVPEKLACRGAYGLGSRRRECFRD